jgi:4-hydroxy-4-methyl-2-oxoglutarate aldolase
MKDPYIERLSKLDTCAVSDAADSLGIACVADGITAKWDCPRIAGRAVTVKLTAGSNKGSKRHLGTSAIEAATSNHIIVVDNRGRSEAAGWGGVLSYAAKQKGLQGVIIDGACRDIDESKSIGFPVYAKTVIPKTARGRIKELSFNEEIEMNGITVQPEDLVLADGSGVVFIPHERASEIIELAEKIAAREAEMIKKIKSGLSVAEVMGANYESMLKKG